MIYQSTKTWGQEVGLSACFRQWRAANSHCQYLHGYALGIRLVFQADALDQRQWVLDFGGFEKVEAWLRDQFDHKTVVASDDPQLATFKALDKNRLILLVVLDNVGCEAFAEHVARYVKDWLRTTEHAERVRLISAEVFEHGANSARVLL